MQAITGYIPFQVTSNRLLVAGPKGAVIRTTAGGGPLQQSTAKLNATPTKQIAIASAQQKGTSDTPQSPTKSQQQQQHVMIRQQIGGAQVVQKVATQPGTVVVSGGQMFAPGQIVVSGNQVIGTPTQVSFPNILCLRTQRYE